MKYLERLRRCQSISMWRVTCGELERGRKNGTQRPLRGQGAWRIFQRFRWDCLCVQKVLSETTVIRNEVSLRDGGGRFRGFRLFRDDFHRHDYDLASRQTAGAPIAKR